MQRLTATRQQTLVSPSPPPLPTLPLDLIEDEILWRLPVKHLLQLRCVCKPWKTLISNPQFAKKHLLRCGSPKENRIIVKFSSMQLHEFILRSYPLPSIFNPDVASAATDLTFTYPFSYSLPTRIVGSCDGILCVSFFGCPAFLWNPSIRKFKTLPLLHQYGIFRICGVGYDRCAGSYKVVYIFRNFMANTEVKVLTLGTDYWRSIRDQFPDNVSPLDDWGPFVGDSINWLTRRVDVPKSWVIVSLDLRNETFGEVSQPDYRDLIVTLSLSVLRDCLCLLSGTQGSLDVWIMKDYGNKKSWTKLLKHDYYDEIPRDYNRFKPLNVSEDGHQVLLHSYQSELIVFNSKDSTVKIPELQNIISEPIVLSSTVYVESLISPCS